MTIDPKKTSGNDKGEDWIELSRHAWDRIRDFLSDDRLDLCFQHEGADLEEPWKGVQWRVRSPWGLQEPRLAALWHCCLIYSARGNKVYRVDGAAECMGKRLSGTREEALGFMALMKLK